MTCISSVISGNTFPLDLSVTLNCELSAATSLTTNSILLAPSGDGLIAPSIVKPEGVGALSNFPNLNRR